MIAAKQIFCSQFLCYLTCTTLDYTYFPVGRYCSMKWCLLELKVADVVQSIRYYPLDCRKKIFCSQFLCYYMYIVFVLFLVDANFLSWKLQIRRFIFITLNVVEVGFIFFLYCIKGGHCTTYHFSCHVFSCNENFHTAIHCKKVWLIAAFTHNLPLYPWCLWIPVPHR